MDIDGSYCYGKLGHWIKECTFAKKKYRDSRSQAQSTTLVSQSGHPAL